MGACGPLNSGGSATECNVDDSGFPRTPDRLLESFGTRARRSEVFGTMMGACGPLNSGGSATVVHGEHTLNMALKISGSLHVCLSNVFAETDLFR